MFSLPRTFAFGIVIAMLALPLTGQQTSSAVLSDSQSSQSQTQARPTLTSVSAHKGSLQTFRGTIRRDMDGYILRDSTGATYDLDDQTRIRAFEGQNVKLKGKLNASTGAIRVLSIEPSY